MLQNSEQVICEFCDYKTNRPFNLKRHMVRKHITENSVVGTENSVDKTENSVDKTENSVVGTENSVVGTENSVVIRCTKCHKEFARKYNLKVHMETCTGLKNPFNCNYCNKSFITRSNKYHHQKICKEKNKEISIVNNNTTIINNTIKVYFNELYINLFIYKSYKLK